MTNKQASTKEPGLFMANIAPVLTVSLPTEVNELVNR